MIKVSDDMEPDVHLRVVQLTSQLPQPTCSWIRQINPDTCQLGNPTTIDLKFWFQA